MENEDGLENIVTVGIIRLQVYSVIQDCTGYSVHRCTELYSA